MVNLKQIGPRVKRVLQDNPSTRNNDNKLTAIIWSQDLRQQGKDANLLTAQGFMKMYYEGKLTNSDSITRARRKLQELHPELRGKNYQARQANQEKVKKDLGY
jgi:hypothetical protein